MPGVNTQTIGYSAPYLGPVVRMKAAGNTRAQVSNSLDFPVTIHWHGLIIPGPQDGGPHQLIGPGAKWTPELTVNQPATMAWYHSHVHGYTAQQVYAGLAGVLILDDGRDEERGLPVDYGVDDLVLVVQDKRINSTGQVVYGANMRDRMMGFAGNTMLVNGQVDALATVPKSLVRLRLLNASNGAVHVIEFDDGRPFHIVAADQGYLEKPVEVRAVRLAPGERVQVLADFSGGGEAELVSTPESIMIGGGMMGMMMRGRQMMSAFSGGAVSLLAFRTDASLPAKVRQMAVKLDGDRLPQNRKIAQTRRFRLQAGMGMMGGGMMRGGGMTINGASFDMGRVDTAVKLGTVEKWLVEPDMLAHPFHVHGVRFKVLSQGGKTPRAENAGWKDTVLVTDVTELLIHFTQPAPANAPYMYHCHILEHEDAGMMAQLVVA